MFSSNTQAAVIQLQQQALRTRDVYDLDRIDRAIDELVRNSGKDTPAPFQGRSAMANANKVLQDRRRMCRVVPLDRPSSEDGPSTYDVARVDGAPDELDIRLWLETTPSLNPLQRDLLRALADGHDAQSIAKLSHVSVARIRERISRARAAGWAAYQREMLPS